MDFRIRFERFLPPLVLMVLAAGPAIAAEPAAETSDRTLAGHTFIPSDTLPAPFVTTHFSTTTGLGIARVSAGDAELNLVYLGEWLDLQVGLTPWLGLRGQVSGNVFSGSDLGSAVDFGARVGYDWSAGVVIGIVRTDWLQLSVSVDYAGDKGIQLSPAQALAETLSSGTINASTLFTKSTMNAIDGGVDLAVGLHDCVGLWLSGRYQHAWSKVEGAPTDSGGEILTGAGLSFDLHPITRIPVGLMGYYLLDMSLAEGADPVHNFGGGFFYTGRTNLAVGVEVVATQTTSGEVDLFGALGAFRLRYYW